ncbi:3228_t:CDS:2 [Funneliformis caledonium]|uniref:3228_t:CDS:1 n=1 Tax=Funneliformis caledonium TaxID=1117310 RepID=A0A9N9A0D9_9GLOM|nr:3228_t:CDS:2 [Funneliformis caledonium]
MSTSKVKTSTSQVKDKKTTIWVLKIFFSPYKASEDSIKCRSFVSKQLAQEAMQRVARRLYKRSVNIQGSDSKYFDDFPMEIHFGESLDSPDYRREFGFCRIEQNILEDKESGDEVPSSTDDEQEYDY